MIQVYSLLSLSFFVLIVHAAPIEKDGDAQIISNVYTIGENGNYEFSFVTSNGIRRQETGTIINIGQPNEYILVNGQYSYFDTEGNEVTVKYIADENGYRLDLKDTPFPVPAPPSLISENVIASLLGK